MILAPARRGVGGQPVGRPLQLVHRVAGALEGAGPRQQHVLVGAAGQAEDDPVGGGPVQVARHGSPPPCRAPSRRRSPVFLPLPFAPARPPPPPAGGEGGGFFSSLLFCTLFRKMSASEADTRAAYFLRLSCSLRLADWPIQYPKWGTRKPSPRSPSNPPAAPTPPPNPPS